MSIRRLLILALVAINLLTATGLLVYLLKEDSVARQVVADRRALMELTREQLLRGPVDEAGDALLGAFERQLESALLQGAEDPERRGPPLRTLLAMREIPILEDPDFLDLVESVIVLRLSPGRSPVDPANRLLGARWFNLSPQLLFDKPMAGEAEPYEFVRRAIDAGNRYGSGQRLAGPLRLRGNEWGGWYLQVRAPVQERRIAREAGLSILAVVVLIAPALLLGPILLWGLLSSRVIAPLEQIGAVAATVSAGDYRPRLDPPVRDDEVAQTMLLLNKMLDLVQDYRETLEDRVLEKTEELERRQRELRLAQRLAATGTLAAGIAHEINNPLGGMLNVARSLRKPDLDPERRERYLAVLEENIQRIGEIVRKVLEVAPRQTTPVAVDLDVVVTRAIDLVHHRARSRQIALEVTFEEGLPAVLGESNELGQVALNLLINAVDASPDGATVTVAAIRDGSSVELSIADRGGGMDAETRAQAFDLFFTTKGGSGTGLGLALVHGIVEGHGGSIRIDSEPGEGTEVIVRLPAVESGDG